MHVESRDEDAFQEVAAIKQAKGDHIFSTPSKANN